MWFLYNRTFLMDQVTENMKIFMFTRRMLDRNDLPFTAFVKAFEALSTALLTAFCSVMTPLLMAFEALWERLELLSNVILGELL